MKHLLTFVKWLLILMLSGLIVLVSLYLLLLHALSQAALSLSLWIQRLEYMLATHGFTLGLYEGTTKILLLNS
jgi:hypothetical protein